VVHPGDVIVGDDNGVVVVPRGSAEDLIDRLDQRSATDAEYLASVARGEFSNQWVDDVLRGHGLRPDSS
jgi:regulator of RNase E activity RraA